jgi:hypothetical protein
MFPLQLSHVGGDDHPDGFLAFINLSAICGPTYPLVAPYAIWKIPDVVNLV